ncbi:hypothetical protein PV728_01660 [Streptomyces europaeiscabiei]|uniref:hypothetical protein n=1 Tax=Streptomyces europaeiscabiei TaxID=146819 RepID=UPI0029BB623C|nr:hypothetical protein [Streptomyces europaeiscabiei]MDX3629035.1 hypothetical protein [Streptomyces europaeiscabiei]MDX3647347.1 hypothetical protein [Streptomyces europaeiscabiei]
MVHLGPLTRLEIDGQDEPMADGPQRTRPISELRASGLLWLINRTVFHPRGIALALVYGEAGEVTGWQLIGDGSEPMWFSPDDEGALFAAAKATLSQAAEATQPPPRLVKVDGVLTEGDADKAREALRQMNADPHGLKAGMVVQPYTDHGAPRYVFRCWGTDDGCEGLVSLDHTTRTSAESARERHLAEAHQPARKETMQKGQKVTLTPRRTPANPPPPPPPQAPRP